MISLDLNQIITDGVVIPCDILSGHIQLIDFGLAKWMKIGQHTRTVCGTLQYIGEYAIHNSI